ncbi:MAG: TPM domain-containing protein, partial [Acidiferrobacterales bacterium]
MRQLAKTFWLALLCALSLTMHPAGAANSNVLNAGRPAFPALTGPVVDDARLLSPQVRQALEQKLLDYARHTSNQVVVVTLPSLHGYPIDEYGYQLGRHWGIGQKGKNNGALLVVDAGGKKVRIEVGYGLEGTLTDAASFEIIHNLIVPRFKKGDYAGGIVAGTDAIMSVIGNHAAAVQRAQVRQKTGTGALMLVVLLFVISPLIVLLFARHSGIGPGPGGP